MLKLLFKNGMSLSNFNPYGQPNRKKTVFFLICPKNINLVQVYRTMLTLKQMNTLDENFAEVWEIPKMLSRNCQ